MAIMAAAHRGGGVVGVSFANPSFLSFLLVMACDAVFITYFSFRKMAKRQGERRRAGRQRVAMLELMAQATSQRDPHGAMGRGISRGLVLLLAGTCGAAVANLYYAQPLLDTLAKAFGVNLAQLLKDVDLI